MATVRFDLHRPNWQTLILFTLGFWLSGSLLVDLLIMPGLYWSGMMTEPGFAIAGNLIFGIFNRIELLCAAVVLTGFLTLLQDMSHLSRRYLHWAIALAVALLIVPLMYTYALTPTMSAMGLQLNLFETFSAPAAMNSMHQSYWLLEVCKLTGIGLLLNGCFQRFGDSSLV